MVDAMKMEAQEKDTNIYPTHIHIYKVHAHTYITYKIHNSQNNTAKGNTKRTQLDVKKVSNKAKSLSEWERQKVEKG